MKKIILAASLVIAATQAQAEFPVGKLGLNLAPRADIELDTSLGNPDGDGNGFGFAGELGGEMVFGYVEYQMLDLEVQSVDLDTEETRFGIGLRTGGDAGQLVARVEHYDVSLDLPGGDADDDGFGVHIGGELPLGAAGARLFGSVGFLALDDLDGNEFRLGASTRLSDTAEIFAAYRLATLEDDANDEIELSDIRLGVNLLF